MRCSSALPCVLSALPLHKDLRIRVRCQELCRCRCEFVFLVQSVKNTKIRETREDGHSSRGACFRPYRERSSWHSARRGPSFRVGSDIYDLRHWGIRKRSLKIYLMYLHRMHAGDRKNRRIVTYFITKAYVSSLSIPASCMCPPMTRRALAAYNLTQPKLLLAYKVCVEQLGMVRISNISCRCRVR